MCAAVPDQYSVSLDINTWISAAAARHYLDRVISRILEHERKGYVILIQIRVSVPQ